MSSVIPAPGWVFVRRVLPAATTAGGIHIPETVRRKHPGITPGESGKVEVLAVSPEDQECWDAGYSSPTTVGDIVFVLALNDNFVPVVTDEHGQVTLENGFQVPETYLFKLSAIAGRVAKEEGPTPEQKALMVAEVREEEERQKPGGGAKQ